MKIWRHGLFGAVLAGGIWTGLWQILVTIALILTTGTGLTLQAGPAMLAGMAGGIIAILFRPVGRLLKHCAGIMIMAVLFIWIICSF